MPRTDMEFIRHRGFRAALRIQLPEIQKMLDDGLTCQQVARRLKVCSPESFRTFLTQECPALLAVANENGKKRQIAQKKRLEETR